MVTSLAPYRSTAHRGRSATRGHSRYAAREVQAAYPVDEPATGAPFGLPVLAEIPELARILTATRDADRLLVEAVLELADLLGTDRVESTTGIGIDHWLAATARATRLDRSLLRRMCRLLDRLPALRGGAADGRLSFAQLRALTLDLSRAPRVADEPLDAWLAAAIDQLPADADPDVIVKQAAKALDELIPELLEEEEEAAESSRSLQIQPNLFGTGGTFHGTEDALGLAMLEAATAPRREQLDLDLGRARADNLQAHLRHVCTDPDGPGSDGAGSDGPQPDGPPEGRALGTLAPPKLLLRWDLDALLDRTATPAAVLTRLVGGKLRLTSSAARRLIEERGAEVRSIVVDQGEVIGVGRTARIPGGWLRDVTLALHDTCTGPLCDRPALGADLDHAQPWTPARPDEPGGRTDADNLGPLCGATNREKEASGWRATQTTRGARRWEHRRSGVTITSVPGTWRPRGVDPPPRRRRERSGAPPAPGADPPDDVPF